jgi:hypothetical protein
MLGNEELLAWFQRVRLPERGRSIIHQVRSSNPDLGLLFGCQSARI